MTLFSLADRAPDAALLAGLACGDEWAAVGFVRRFEGPVFGLALAVTRDRGLAEEVSQEAFLRAWRAAPTYDQRLGSVMTWLLTITRNLAIDAVRARRTTPMDSDVMEQLLTTTLRGGQRDEVGVHLEAAEAAARLRDLPPEQARAVVLAVIGGNTALRRLRQALEVEHD